MSRFDLPEGVSPDNSSQSLSGGDDQASFVAPDMATPSFAKGRPETGANYSRIVEGEDVEAGFSGAVHDEGDDDDISIPMPPKSWMVTGGIGLALVVLAYFITDRNVSPQPYCSELPVWNQYNCIPD